MQNYLMVGAGGTGSHLMPHLVPYLSNHHKDGAWALHVIDGDVVENKNLERQLFIAGAVTQNKAIAACNPYDKEHVFPHDEYLSEASMAHYIRDGDIVFICADNFTVRKRIEDHALTLKNVVIINGGNEKTDGSVQLMVRDNAKPVTPRIGYLHPEIAVGTTEDRAEMTCAQAAALPGGEQTMIANLQAATWMLTALWRFHENRHVIKKGTEAGPATWTELQYDMVRGTVDPIDQRITSTWRN